MHDYFNDIIEKFISLRFIESLKFTVGSDVNDDSSFFFHFMNKTPTENEKKNNKNNFPIKILKKFLYISKEYDDRCRDNITYNYSFHKSVDGMNECDNRN